MRREPIGLSALALAALAASACVPPGSRPTPPGAVGRIYQVQTVEPSVFETYPAQLRIIATGLARNGGWTGPELRPAGRTADGTALFDFVARAPSGMATQALTPLTATYTLGPVGPDQPRAVAVRAETNAVRRALGP